MKPTSTLLAALEPFIAGRNVEFNGRVGGRIDKNSRFCRRAARRAACALIFSPPFPPRQSPWRLAAA